ncbi:hypothetical protein SUGI_0258700 [Cryptomeria japonica]|nr:hypothetical protein SUGI_0258700 [Cryptomeria japonica]
MGVKKGFIEGEARRRWGVHSPFFVEGFGQEVVLHSQMAITEHRVRSILQDVEMACKQFVEGIRFWKKAALQTLFIPFTWKLRRLFLEEVP